MNVDPFVAAYWPFHLINYALAALAYTLIGRVILSIFVSPNSAFFIMRFFRTLTDWVIRLTGPVTPRFLHPFFVPFYVAFLVFVVRIALGLLMLNLGLAPRISDTIPA
jgi:YggT family protein